MSARHSAVVTARRSRFATSWDPVIDPAGVLRLARRRFGLPSINREAGVRFYHWPVNVFDLLSIRVERRS